jgi:hypothetical protein
VPELPDGVVLPPVNAPAPAGDGRMTLMSPVGAEEGNQTDWLVVVGVALVAEIGLLWGAACIGLWRRRLALSRAVAAG